MEILLIPYIPDDFHPFGLKRIVKTALINVILCLHSIIKTAQNVTKRNIKKTLRNLRLFFFVLQFLVIKFS